MKFKKVEKEHQPIVKEWLNKPHVREYFYGAGLENTLKNLDLYGKGINDNGDYFFDHWIAYMDDRPFGFLMTTPVVGPYDPNDPYNKFFVEGEEVITLDVLIGEEEFLGKGLAHKMIQDFLKDKFPNVGIVLIDLAASNEKAIHVYEKAGFKKVEKFFPKFEPEAPHWMMQLNLSKISSIDST